MVTFMPIIGLRVGSTEMGEKLTTFYPAEGLNSDEAVAVFMEEAFKTGDDGYIAHASGVVARAKGTMQIANQTMELPVRLPLPDRCA
jgi:DNA-binding phage protein